MKLGFTTLLATALAALLLVPAAGAGPGGNGKGKGGGSGTDHGPPSWVGGGGKPDTAAKAEAKAAKKAAQAERRAARRSASAADGEEPRHDNPAWVCKFEREQMGTEAFAEEYGTNENKANAFGKCVSREAHDRDGVTPEEPPTEPVEGEETPPAEGDEGDPAEGGEEATGVQALMRYLWPVLYA